MTLQEVRDVKDRGLLRNDGGGGGGSTGLNFADEGGKNNSLHRTREAQRNRMSVVGVKERVWVCPSEGNVETSLSEEPVSILVCLLASSEHEKCTHNDRSVNAAV